MKGHRWMSLKLMGPPTVDDEFDLRETVKFAPVDGRYKVYIIDEVHMLTAEAFNALLKTLEEPPAHVVFIFWQQQQKLTRFRQRFSPAASGMTLNA